MEDENSTEDQKQDAVDQICCSHIRFVSQYAHYYARRCSADVEDLIGAGVVGIMTAIDKFRLESFFVNDGFLFEWTKSCPPSRGYGSLHPDRFLRFSTLSFSLLNVPSSSPLSKQNFLTRRRLCFDFCSLLSFQYS